MQGSYCLIIKNKKQTQINVGAIKTIDFKCGFYVYIGSAMNSLIPRINRHLSDEKKIHWHIDYLLKNENTNIEEILFNIGKEEIECKLAKTISKEGKEIEKFGSSDCNCNSHLIYFENIENSLNSIKNAYNNLNIDYYDIDYFKTLD